ncbi:hypothetical protein GCM10023169_12550 [Georgenia halophila]|uniref:Uncharacterized protein n=1 Tax=Georgenia halophila TaxID=620889 RepID=A0ABP8L1Y4_9MICO
MIPGLAFLVPSPPAHPCRRSARSARNASSACGSGTLRGSPSDSQPRSSRSPLTSFPLWLEDLLRPLDADVVEAIRERHRADENPHKAWIIVTPSKHAVLTTTAEDTDNLVEVFLELYGNLVDATA